jgi:hypothetical protein
LALIALLIIPCALAAEDSSLSFVSEIIELNRFITKNITITNTLGRQVSVYLSPEGNISPFVEIYPNSFELRAGASRSFNATIYGNEDPLKFRNRSYFNYNGAISVLGLGKKIPVSLIITDGRITLLESILLSVSPASDSFTRSEKFSFTATMTSLMTGSNPSVKINYSILGGKNESQVFLGSDTVNITTSKTLLKEFSFPENISEGNHILRVQISYSDKHSIFNSPFKIVTPFYLRRFLGIAVWQYTAGFFILALGAVLFYFQRKKINAAKRYGVSVDFKTFPSEGRRVKVGKFAEYNRDFFYDLDRLTTHCIVAGATGSGKSVAAQVLIEEALKAGVAVVVFDPTAQWSGFLRPCVDGEMLRLYGGFGLRRSDARGFSGNVRQVLDAREVVDVRRFMRGGEVEILSLNRLRPEEIDVFVANTVRSVFDANLDECRDLRLLLVYDEVHRLLPRFGGSGEGFVQIERACREFRKWGVGVVLISQVLTDFVGEIKANINTELQMRTRDEGDLGRIREKYGDSYLKGLVRASVGTGMLENPVYNGGRPFFVSFRPLLHSVVRLSDGELGEYNRFNGVLDDLDFEVGELERLGLDVFDLRLELKLAGDKLRVGGFGMVDVYLEGLVPRVKAEFDNLKKPVPKRVVVRLSDADLKKEKKEAEKGRQAFAKTHPAEVKKVVAVKAPEIIAPYTFNNGAMVSDLNELKDALEPMGPDILRSALTGNSTLASWVKSNLKNDSLALILSKAKSKKDILDAVNAELGKSKKEDKKEEKPKK